MLIPSISIQPIVENCITHGLEEMIGVCHIHIFAECMEDETRIIVEDKGPGFSEEKLEEILLGKEKLENHGIGLKNIHRRLQMAFNEKCGLACKRNGEWMQVIIRLPKVDAWQATSL